MEKIQELEYEIENLKEQLEEYQDMKRAIRNLNLEQEVDAEISHIQLSRIYNKNLEQLRLLHKAIEKAGLEKHMEELIKSVIEDEKDEVPF